MLKDCVQYLNNLNIEKKNQVKLTRDLYLPFLNNTVDMTTKTVLDSNIGCLIKFFINILLFVNNASSRYTRTAKDGSTTTMIFFTSVNCQDLCEKCSFVYVGTPKKKKKKSE